MASEKHNYSYEEIYGSGEEQIELGVNTLSDEIEHNQITYLDDPAVPNEYYEDLMLNTVQPPNPTEASSRKPEPLQIETSKADPSNPSTKSVAAPNKQKQRGKKASFWQSFFQGNEEEETTKDIEAGTISTSKKLHRKKSQYKKAKSFAKHLSQVYMNQLKETTASRFADWSRDELIEILIRNNYELRFEFAVTYDSLIDAAEAIFLDKPVPEKPELPTTYELVLQNAMARRIQDAWINYWSERRLISEFQQMNKYKKTLQKFSSQVDFNDLAVGSPNTRQQAGEGFFQSALDDEEAYEQMYLQEVQNFLKEEIAEDDELLQRYGEDSYQDELERMERLYQLKDLEDIRKEEKRRALELGSASSDLEANETGTTAGERFSISTQPAGLPTPPTTTRPTDQAGLKQFPSHLLTSLAQRQASKGNLKLSVFDIPWMPPDLNVAKNYANYVQPRKNRKTGLFYDFWRTTTGRFCYLGGCGEQFDLWEEGQVSEFSQYGSGVTNYFKFIKWGFWLFFILSLVSLPVLILNISASAGNNSNSGLKGLAKTTLGNLQFAMTDNNTAISVFVPGCAISTINPYGCRLNGENLAWLYSCLDIAICGIVMIGYLWLVYFENFEEHELNLSVVKPSMYSIAVGNLPATVTEDELITHFSKLLKCSPDVITNVALAYNNQEEIQTCFERGELIKQKIQAVHSYRHTCTLTRMSGDYDLKAKEYDEFLSKEKQKMLNRIKDVNAELAKKEKYLELLANTPESNRVIYAFITFDKARYRDEILAVYNHFTIYDFLCSSKHLYLQGKHLKVTEAPEPSVIIWENLMWSRWHRIQRRLMTTFFTLLLIVLSLIMIFASKYVSITAGNNGGTTSGDSVCPSTWDSMTEEEQIAWIKANKEDAHCYCDNLSPLDQAQDGSHCRHYLIKNIESQVLLYFASFVILLVNYLMEKLLKFSSKYEKHHTNDGLNNSLFYRLFFLKYINSAGIFLINNNNIILRSLFGVSISSSPNFTADWYNTVGVTIILVQLGDMINCHSDILYKCYQYYNRRNLSFKHPEQRLTQDELNTSIIGPKFDLAYNYSQLLTSIFISFTFSAGIPLLYPIACANFAVYYMLEKYLFVNMYKIPPHFNLTIGRRVTFFIPVALTLHVLMSIWMYSNHKLFMWGLNDDNTNSQEADDDFYSYYYSAQADKQFQPTYLKDRLNNHIIVPLIIALAGVIFIWLAVTFIQYLKLIFYRIHTFLFQCFETGRLSAHQGDHPRGSQRRLNLNEPKIVVKTRVSEPTRYLVTFTRALQRNLIKGLASYNILQNPRYKEAFGITWKFAMDHTRVASVRNLQLRALNPVDDDNIEDMEGSAVLRRRTLTKSNPRPTTDEKVPEQKETEGKKGLGQRHKSLRIQTISRNKSFYQSFHQPKPDEERVLSIDRSRQVSPSHDDETRPRRNTNSEYYFNSKVKDTVLPSGKKSPVPASDKKSKSKPKQNNNKNNNNNNNNSDRSNPPSNKSSSSNKKPNNDRSQPSSARSTPTAGHHHHHHHHPPPPQEQATTPVASIAAIRNINRPVSTPVARAIPLEVNDQFSQSHSNPVTPILSPADLTPTRRVGNFLEPEYSADPAHHPHTSEPIGHGHHNYPQQLPPSSAPRVRHSLPHPAPITTSSHSHRQQFSSTSPTHRGKDMELGSKSHDD